MLIQLLFVLFLQVDVSNYTSKVITSSAYWNIKTICYSILLPIILLVGCVGNSLNVVVFTRGRFRHTLDEIERAAATGLVALAISNLCFCAVGLPAVLFTNTDSYGASTTWDVITGKLKHSFSYCLKNKQPVITM